MSEINQPSLRDELWLELFNSPENINRSPGIILTGYASVGAAAGAGIGIHEGLFPKNDKYDEVSDRVDKLTLKVAEIKDARNDFRQYDLRFDRQQTAQELALTEVEVESAKNDLPSGYNPNVDAAVSVTGGIATGVIAFLAARALVKRRLTTITSNQE